MTRVLFNSGRYRKMPLN